MKKKADRARPKTNCFVVICLILTLIATTIGSASNVFAKPSQQPDAPTELKNHIYLPLVTNGADSVNAALLGGSTAPSDKYLSEVAIYRKKSGWGLFDSPSKSDYVCGGTLIAPEWVLTALHCVVDNIDDPNAPDTGTLVSVSQYKVAAGTHEVVPSVGFDWIVNSASFNVDPSSHFVFQKDANGNYVLKNGKRIVIDAYHDMALIHLGSSISTGSRVQYASILRYGVNDLSGIIGTVVGWGLTDASNASSIANNLQMENLTISSSDSQMASDGKLRATISSGQGVCHGDSGNGFFWLGIYSGAVSLGQDNVDHVTKFCDTNQSWGQFARPNILWIQSIVGNGINVIDYVPLVQTATPGPTATRTPTPQSGGGGNATPTPTRTTAPATSVPGAPSLPVVTSPYDFQQFSSGSLIRVSWGASSNATSYYFDLVRNNALVGYNRTSNTFWDYGSLPDGDYVFQIRADNDHSSSDWTNYRHFRVGNPPTPTATVTPIPTATAIPVPSNLSPATGSQFNQGTDIHFSWTAVSTYDYIEIYSIFGTLLIRSQCSCNVNHLDTLAPGGYYWRIGASNDGVNIFAWSEPNIFNIFPVSTPTPIAPPGKPTLASPVNNGTVTPGNVTFTWTAGDRAEWHLLEVQNVASGTVVLLQHVDGTSWTTSLPAGKYVWHVESHIGTNYWSGWTDPWTLDVSNPNPTATPTSIATATPLPTATSTSVPPPDAPIITSPVENQSSPVNTQVSLDYYTTNALFYNVEIWRQQSDGTESLYLHYPGITPPSFPLDVLPIGKYRASVNAGNGSGTSAWSLPRHFMYSYQPTYPTHNESFAYGQAIGLQWIGTHTDRGFYLWLNGPHGGHEIGIGTFATAYTVNDVLEPGQWCWQLREYSGGVNGATSITNCFTVLPEPTATPTSTQTPEPTPTEIPIPTATEIVAPEAPALIAPDPWDNIPSESAAVIAWNAVWGADHYHYVVYRDDLMQGAVSVVDDVTTGTQVSIPNLIDGEYWVIVEAYNQWGMWSMWSSPQLFFTIGTIVLPDAPVITAPNENAEFTHGAYMHFEWNPVGLAEYDVDFQDSSGNTVFPGHKPPGDTSMDIVLPEIPGEYHFRIQAWNNGVKGPWSDRRIFVVGDATATPTASNAATATPTSNVATQTPVVTATATATSNVATPTPNAATATPTQTSTPLPVTNTPTATATSNVATATATATSNVATQTPVASPTPNVATPVPTPGVSEVLTPKEGAVFTAGDTITVTFKATSAARYNMEIWVDYHDGNGETLFDHQTDTAQTVWVYHNAPVGSYRVIVNANNDVGNSDWGAPIHFVVKPAHEIYLPLVAR